MKILLKLFFLTAAAAALNAQDTDLDAPPEWLYDIWVTAEGHNPNHYASHGERGFQMSQFRLMDYSAVRYRSDRGAQYMDSLPQEDFTLEMVDRIRAAGMRPQGYIVPYRSELGFSKPEWRMLDWNGNPVDDHGPCLDFMSPWGDELIARLLEVEDKYGVDMIWLDGFMYQYHGGARGEYAVERFKRDTGLDMPEKFDMADPVCRRWLEWRGTVLADYLQRMQREVRGKHPETAFAVNALRYMMWPPWQAWGYEALERVADLPCAEYSWYLGNDPVHKRFLYARLRGVRGTRPAFSWIVPNVDGGMQVPAPEAETMSRVYTCLVQRVGIGLMPDLLPEALAEKIVDEVMARAPFLKKAADVRYAALVATERDDWFFDQTDRSYAYRHNYEGIYRMLNEMHIPVDVISEYDILNGGLEGYSVVILPGQHCLADDTAAALKEYVAAGGGLIATDKTGAYDAYAVPRQASALAELFGCEFVDGDFTDLKMENKRTMEIDREHPFAAGEELGLYLVNRTLGRGEAGALGADGNVRDPEAVADVDRLGLEGQPLRLRATEARGGQPVAWLLDGELQRQLPALYANRYGEGKVAFFPMDLGGMYAVSSYPQWRLLFENALREVAPEEPWIYAEAPQAVQFEPTFQEAEGRYVIHLLNDHLQSLIFLDQPRRVRQDLPPIAGVRVVVKDREIPAAWAEPMHQPLPLEYLGGDTVITVPVLRDHLMVVFDE